MNLVGLDLVARRHRRGLFSIGHVATTMLHTLSNLTGNSWHKDQKQESRCKSWCRASVSFFQLQRKKKKKKKIIHVL